MARTSVIGGEAGHRSTFGGGVSRGRMLALALSFMAFLALALVIGQQTGVMLGLAVVMATWLVTMPTRRGSLMQRIIRRRSWREQQRRGTWRFVPWTREEWDRLQERAMAKKELSRKERREAVLELAALRDVPDGASGMGWLQDTARMPGIAWHAPVGEPSYLSVAFEVSGQARGLENQTRSDSTAEAWGRFKARLGGEDSLAKMIQTTTRVLPPDSARHQAWMVEHLDPDVPEEMLRSYDETIRLADRSSMIQRHYVVVRWPISSDFKAEARRYGTGRDGWRLLMADEISSITEALATTGHNSVRPITARQLAAVLLHMQNPSRPIDQVRGVQTDQFGLPSWNEWSAMVVPAIDEETGEEIEWWHRTAKITAEDVSVAERTSLWLMPMLSGTSLQARRTISIQEWMVPGSIARQAARQDVTRDAADNVSKQEAGKLLDDETNVNLSSAQRRQADLQPGRQVAGVEWVAYITVSARSRHELARVCRKTESVAANDLGIERLHWLDAQQSGAMGMTWPIARGLRPPRQRASNHAMSVLTGKKEKEAL